MTDDTERFIDNDPYSQAMLALAARSTAHDAMLLRLIANIAGRVGITLDQFTGIVQEIAADNPEHGHLFAAFKPDDEVRRSFSVIEGGKKD